MLNRNTPKPPQLTQLTDFQWKYRDLLVDSKGLKLKRLQSLLKHPKPHVRESVRSTIAGIAYGTHDVCAYDINSLLIVNIARTIYQGGKVDWDEIGEILRIKGS